MASAVLVLCLLFRHALASPYTPCGGSCTSDGFVAGGEPGVWVGQVCPAKCAECQSDGVLRPAPPNASFPPPLPSNHRCQTSPNSMYLQPTYANSSQFSVRIAGQSLFTPTIREYIGHVHYAQALVTSSHNTFVVQLLDSTIIPDPTQVSTLKICYFFGNTDHAIVYDGAVCYQARTLCFLCGLRPGIQLAQVRCQQRP